jgi:hypothetical protein
LFIIDWRPPKKTRTNERQQQGTSFNFYINYQTAGPAGTCITSRATQLASASHFLLCIGDYYTDLEFVFGAVPTALASAAAVASSIEEISLFFHRYTLLTVHHIII